jgi:HAD domain in Swiss Army Knife RNA repair proteins
LNQGALENLRTLLDLSKAKLVISSTWRLDDSEDGWRKLLKHGFTESDFAFNPEYQTIDSALTPVLRGDGNNRGSEIAQWLNVASATGYLKDKGPLDLVRYVIIDDDSDFYPAQKRYFAQIDGGVGLTLSDVAVALDILHTGKAAL